MGMERGEEKGAQGISRREGKGREKEGGEKEKEKRGRGREREGEGGGRRGIKRATLSGFKSR